MTEISFNPNKIQPRNRRRLLISFAVLTYGVFLGEIYSVVNFNMWAITHLLTVAVLLFGLLLPAIKNKHWPVTTLDAPLLIMFIIMVISALVSDWMRLALEGLFVWSSHFLAFYLAARLVYRGWADSLLRALMLVTGLVILIALFETAAWYFGLPFVPNFSQGWWEIGGISNPVPPYWYRLSFTLSNSVILSAFLVVVIPVTIAFAATTRNISDQVLVWLFVLTELFILAAAQSRGGWLGLGAALFCFTFLWLYRNYSRWQNKQKKLLLIILAGAGLLLFAAITYYIWSLSANRSASNAQRLAYWAAAVQIFGEHPVWGIGPGLFRWGWRLTPFATEIDYRVVTAHSIYLNQLTELGMMGVLVGVWLLAVAAYTAWQVLTLTANHRLWWRRAGCAAGLVGFLAQGLVETFPIWPIVLPVIVLVVYLVVPYSWLSTSDETGKFTRFHQKIGRFAGPVIAAGWIVCVVLISYFAYPRWLAEQARDMAAQENYGAAVKLITQSNKLDPGLTLYQFERANWLAQPALGDYQTAQAAFQTALASEPGYWLNHANLAVTEWQLGYADAAFQSLEQAIKLLPSEGRLWLTLGAYAEQTGQTDRAIAAYTQTLVINPGWVNSNYWEATPWRVAHFDTILKNASDQWSTEQYQYLLITQHFYKGKFNVAQEILNQQPPSPSRFFLAAQISLARGNVELALEYVEEALAINPENLDAQSLKAQILVEAGQPEQADTLIKRINFLGQSNPRSFYAAGRLAEAQGRLDEAETYYQRANTIQPVSLDYGVAVYRQLGSLLPLPQLENTSSGLELQGWLALAALQERRGDFEVAAQTYQILLKNDPYFAVAQNKLADLCREKNVGCTVE